MTNPRQELRATEEAIREDAKTIAHLEEEKEGLDPTDPKVERLSERVRSVAGVLKDKTAAEKELVEEIQASTTRRH
jgi:archaellum component FlaC